MDLLLLADEVNTALELGKIAGQLTATGILAFMWWVARQDLKESRTDNKALELELKTLRDGTITEQRKLISVLSGGKE